MKKTQLLSFFNLLALAGNIAVAYMTQFGLINEQNVGQVSAAYNSLLTPAGITFGIWGVIYTGVLISCIYHLLMSAKHDETHHANMFVQTMGPWFILNNLGAVAWLF